MFVNSIKAGFGRLAAKNKHCEECRSTYSVLAASPYLCRMKILMVCLGNICRSPLAEGIMQQKALQAGLDWQVDSAGTNGYHTGEPPHHFSIKVAALHGIDICDQRSRRFIADDLDEYDIIYAMALDVLQDIKRIAKNNFDAGKVILFLDESFPGQHKDVPDPWYGGEEGYHHTFEIIERNCDTIIKKYLTA